MRTLNHQSSPKSAPLQSWIFASCTLMDRAGLFWFWVFSIFWIFSYFSRIFSSLKSKLSKAYLNSQLSLFCLYIQLLVKSHFPCYLSTSSTRPFVKDPLYPLQSSLSQIGRLPVATLYTTSLQCRTFLSSVKDVESIGFGIMVS